MVFVRKRSVNAAAATYVFSRKRAAAGCSLSSSFQQVSFVPKALRQVRVFEHPLKDVKKKPLSNRTKVACEIFLCIYLLK